MNITSLRDGFPAVTGGVEPQMATTRTAAAREDLGVLLARLPLVGLLAVQAVSLLALRRLRATRGTGSRPAADAAAR